MDNILKDINEIRNSCCESSIMTGDMLKRGVELNKLIRDILTNETDIVKRKDIIDFLFADEVDRYSEHLFKAKFINDFVDGDENNSPKNFNEKIIEIRNGLCENAQQLVLIKKNSKIERESMIYVLDNEADIDKRKEIIDFVCADHADPNLGIDGKIDLVFEFWLRKTYLNMGVESFLEKNLCR
jgi:hypothetical protein